jgi:hypothetical protein
MVTSNPDRLAPRPRWVVQLPSPIPASTPGAGGIDPAFVTRNAHLICDLLDEQPDWKLRVAVAMPFVWADLPKEGWVFLQLSRPSRNDSFPIRFNVGLHQAERLARVDFSSSQLLATPERRGSACVTAENVAEAWALVCRVTSIVQPRDVCLGFGK